MSETSPSQWGGDSGVIHGIFWVLNHTTELSAETPILNGTNILTKMFPCVNTSAPLSVLMLKVKLKASHLPYLAVFNLVLYQVLP
jgi:hypothetical protein